jgi:O-antigen/teichoic acid export membrane protein
VLLILFVPGQMLVIFVLGPNFEESANIVWVVICLSPIIASSQTATALALSSMRESLARKASTVFAAVVIAGCAIGAITAQAIGVLVAVSIASLSKFVILARGLLKTND